MFEAKNSYQYKVSYRRTQTDIPIRITKSLKSLADRRTCPLIVICNH